MNSSNGQTERKRKVSPSSSSSSMDSSGDESTPLRRCVQKNSGKVSRISILNCPGNDQCTLSYFFKSWVFIDSQKNSSSSETDSEDEKCPICLKVLKNQILAITDTCRHHTFCLSCLEEWSKTKRTCPVDRKEYQSVLVLDTKRKVSKELFLKSLFGWYSIYSK